MNGTAHPWYVRHIACPDCGQRLTTMDATVSCSCGFFRPRSTPLDLRPVAPPPRTLSVPVGTGAPADLEHCLVERPANTYSGPAALRDSSELFSAVRDLLTPGATLLDLGCGPRDQAVPAEHFGLEYLGVDYASSSADILADAHALPFEDQSFDFVLSYAVLEHLYNPFLAVREIRRVLKPEGVFFGTVSQGEPFHDSYFHHTAWGLLHVLHTSGLSTSRLWYSYDTLRALATMGRYPRVGRSLVALLDKLLKLTPMLAPRKYFHWPAREKEIDALHRAASICFVARRSATGAARDAQLDPPLHNH